MSANKYANLPDIDTAPDIYETEDVFPSSHANKNDSTDEETTLPARSTMRGKNGDNSAGKEELDFSNLLGSEEASKKFRKAEKRHRQKTHYAYPPSPTSSTSYPSTPSSRPIPLSHRLRALHAELSALEFELADPSNPLLHKEREEDNVDPGELIRGLVDVRGRLEKIRKRKEGRGKLVGVVIGESDGVEDEKEECNKEEKVGKNVEEKLDVRSVVEMDRRISGLEKLVGSSGASLDEVSPLPPPLLPLITRLNSQLNVLTQPRHVDSVSRRLKLLLTDLDRASAQHHSHRRHPSNPPTTGNPPASAVSEQLLPILTRLGPSLPHIPHILTRLRTLSTLHTAAGEFQSTLEGLEESQKQMKESLVQLVEAVDSVEASLEENRGLVKGNVGGLEERVDVLLRRLDELSR